MPQLSGLFRLCALVREATDPVIEQVEPAEIDFDREFVADVSPQAVALLAGVFQICKDDEWSRVSSLTHRTR